MFLAHFGFNHTARHCAAVAREANRLAIRFGERPQAAEIAGWYHDISAVVPNKKRTTLAEQLGLEILPEERRLPMILHQKLSAVFAREIFGISDEEVLSAIGCHTTLKANSSRLDKVVFIADKIQWDQNGKPPYLEAVWLGLGHSLDAGALAYLDYLWQRKTQLPVIHPWLREAYHQLSNE